MITLATRPNEKGTAIFTLEFTDEEGEPIIPSSAAWQLMKSDGSIVNDRNFLSCPFSGTTVVLSGDDLQLFAGDDKKRIFAIQAIYNSTLGNNLPLVEEVKFKINPLLSQ